MHLRYDDDFIESAVFIAASGRRAGVPMMQIRRFHSERERCYNILDPDDRNAAFFKLHLDWFREWGLEKLLLDLFHEYPLLLPALNLLAFRKVKVKKDEGAELYVSAENGRTAVVALRPDRFEKDDLVVRFLRHEFMHLSDMVDPAFGYSPDLHARGVIPTQQRIARERYRLLWDITIDGRLARAPEEGHHRALLDRAYSFWPEQKRREVFAELWANQAPKHEQLLALASDPRDLSHGHQPLPGASCPLCGFPTFDWADAAALSAKTRAAIEPQFPGWAAAQGVCNRCVEIYELAGKFEAPATMVL